MAKKLSDVRKVEVRESFEVYECVTYKDIINNVSRYEHCRYYDPVDKRIYWVRDVLGWIQENRKKQLSKVLIVTTQGKETITLS